MERWGEHMGLLSSYQFLISGRCTNTGGPMANIFQVYFTWIGIIMVS